MPASIKLEPCRAKATCEHANTMSHIHRALVVVVAKVPRAERALGCIFYASVDTGVVLSGWTCSTSPGVRARIVSLAKRVQCSL